MTCFSPITAYRSKKGNGEIVFSTKDGFYDSQFPIACGQCIGCRLEKSRVWAARCMHEAELHIHNHFITLTYDEENIPDNNSLCLRDLQLFWKRLRRHYGKLQYYACGEYGTKFSRPHYHAIIYGIDISDKSPHSINNGNRIYTSEKIKRLWRKGMVFIGDVTFESCAYVARYILKKQLGRHNEKEYDLINEETGEVFRRKKEFTVMSRNPAIGKGYFQKYKTDFYQEGTDGKIIIRKGVVCNTPRIYDEWLKKESEKNEEIIKQIKEKRKNKQIETLKNQDENFLYHRERIINNRINKRLIRPLEVQK